MPRTIEFYFDFVSPYTYLALTQLPALARQHDATIAYRPFRLLELMKLVGNRPTTIESKNKQRYAMTDLARWSAKYGVAVRPNPSMRTTDMAQLLRGALVAADDGRPADYVSAVFKEVWGGGTRDLSQAAGVVDLLKQAGFDGTKLLERAGDPVIVARLDKETADAAERGLFGSPSIFVGNDLFFGNDRLEFVAAALKAQAA